jgi:hypothetical protein
MTREAIQKAGGKYVLEPAERPKITDVTQPKVSQPEPDNERTQLADALNKAVVALNASKEEKTNTELARIVELLSKAGGSWTATVTTRDQKGRILSIDFQQR